MFCCLPKLAYKIQVKLKTVLYLLNTTTVENLFSAHYKILTTTTVNCEKKIEIYNLTCYINEHTHTHTHTPHSIIIIILDYTRTDLTLVPCSTVLM